MAKQKVKEQKTYDCKDCINSLQISQLNCKLKIFEENKETKYSFTFEVVECLWFKGIK